MPQYAACTVAGPREPESSNDPYPPCLALWGFARSAGIPVCGSQRGRGDKRATEKGDLLWQSSPPAGAHPDYLRELQRKGSNSDTCEAQNGTLRVPE
jgi:hypothetical protein